MNSPMIRIEDIDIEVDDSSPRIEDLNLAEALGFERERDIRRLIRGHMSELKKFGKVVCTSSARKSAQTPDSKGGRPARTYFLNEKQALYVCAKSNAVNAVDVTIEMVEVFFKVKTGVILKPKPSKELPNEPRTICKSQWRQIQKFIADHWDADSREAVFEELKDYFGVPRYRDVPADWFGEAMRLLKEIAAESATKNAPAQVDLSVSPGCVVVSHEEWRQMQARIRHLEENVAKITDRALAAGLETIGRRRLFKG
ncbi:Rha family transcriptional regulator [Maritalea mediterranea]|uniref:Rha family transcriptional regulator n=1 Tax=Maritalea mediterranea TaxID=2909667 RepID=A0ABS9E5S0_9HYPH|nr:Rha family transcriptional regulator [Maritalea mediterranea]MCF4098201.1 Rha family transcriptional regulator [Maritalea mediterranea]